MATQAYRNIMRAARVAFNGDAPVLLEAKNQIRQSFLSNAKMGAAEPATAEAIQHANEVANFLRVNLVQGRKMGDADNTYQLRIHKDTERGDNDSIKTAGAGVSGGGCGCK
ncbi:hypothetical protein VHEMI05404 [[Torrubiella] hemipterigena]|uniref:Mitochondrial zinc maintenance protein 1, mitochondrial n=1 Tax=[Torrubiella] hemipterigena TaxID=1531966 RepID=A0A0A1T418_9HYPO|nr:hypothetical protein VHEMI05404 [[Torrubiella] hemipterigena]